jgi:CDP-6-deoxy-D-xylo-4-hexulose-3-dehydrase
MDNTCNKRFGWQLGELPEGYDHKYIYAHLGYNLKPLDIQAAIGREQIKKLPAFGAARRHNWRVLRKGLADLEEFFEFQLPTHALGWMEDGFTWDSSGRQSDPSWFGFMLLVRPGGPFTRTQLAQHLEGKKIGNRMLFGGNLLRQPAFVELRKARPEAMRVVGDMPGADRIMNESLFVGVYPGLTAEMLGYIVETITAFVKTH